MIADRLTAQLLAGPPARDPVAVVERLLAVQGQDQRGFRLAVRSRSTGLSAVDVDRALTDDRSLVLTWVNRGTLHLVRSEDYPWLHALTAPPIARGNARRLAQEGVTVRAADRGVDVIRRSLESDGPLSRDQLRQRLEQANVPTKGQALVHVLLLASLRGLTVRGPVIDGQHAYVLVKDWLDEPGPIDRDVALAELARRYLAGHGPADARDLARWSGLPLRDSRAGLSAIAGELEDRPDGLVDLKRRVPMAELPPPRLLGPFDPVLLGWRSREALVGGDQAVLTVNGVFRPFALVRGRAVATWTMPGPSIVLRPFAPLSRKDRAALATDAQAVARFLGVRSPAPMRISDSER
ncbi:MAG TPA: winged helix DNA-binding domain-containing protein [Acidimicrobiales bacterium]|nr:winged helix DNA-binding domain-containing protein [Acidimicrobiales bacterium]